MFRYVEHLPEVLHEVREFIAIGSVVDHQIAEINLQVASVLDSRLIDTASPDIMRRMYTILGLDYNPDKSPAEQRSEIRARKQMRFVINLARVRAMLAEITGNDATLVMDYDALVMTVQVALSSKHNFGSVVTLLNSVVPANIVVNVSLLYNQHSTLAHMTHAQLSQYTHNQLREDEIHG